MHTALANVLCSKNRLASVRVPLAVQITITMQAMLAAECINQMLLFQAPYLLQDSSIHHSPMIHRRPWRKKNKQEEQTGTQLAMSLDLMQLVCTYRFGNCIHPHICGEMLQQQQQQQGQRHQQQLTKCYGPKYVVAIFAASSQKLLFTIDRQSCCVCMHGGNLQN